LQAGADSVSCAASKLALIVDRQLEEASEVNARRKSLGRSSEVALGKRVPDGILTEPERIFPIRGHFSIAQTPISETAHRFFSRSLPVKLSD
jgi:hypothetical protein